MIRILFVSFLLVVFSFAVSAQEQCDTPKAGEGISTFLERNGRPGRSYYKEFLELNKKALRGKEELRLGVKYQLPPLHAKVAEKEKIAGTGNRVTGKVWFTSRFSGRDWRM